MSEVWESSDIYDRPGRGETQYKETNRQTARADQEQ